MENKKVLLVRLSALGDVIFNLPLANVLKSNGYKVFWITSEKGFDIVNNNPFVDKAILAPVEKWKKQNYFKNIIEYIKIIKYLRSEKFDIAIDTQGLLKSFIWIVLSGAKRRITSKSAREFAHLGGNEIIPKIRTDFNTHTTQNYLRFAEYLNLSVQEVRASLPDSTRECIEKVDALLADIDKSKPIIGVAPATTWVPKHWNKDNWKELVGRLENDYTLIFTGTKKDSELIEYISGNKHLNLVGKTNLLELAELFKRCDLVISLDSGSTHLAWASEKPKIVSIFCCTPKGLYAPIGDDNKYIALSSNLDCQPCHKKHCPLKENKNQCTLHPAVEDVERAVRKLL